MNNRINEYVYLLKISLDYVKESLNEYNSRVKKDNFPALVFHELYYKTNYHMFAFTQLLYAIELRLKNEAKNDIVKCKRIDKFFHNKTSSTGLVYMNLTHKLKHAGEKDGVNFSQLVGIIVNLNKNGKHKTTVTLTDRTISSVNDSNNSVGVKLRGKKLSKLMEEADSELIHFLQKEGFNF